MAIEALEPGTFPSPGVDEPGMIGWTIHVGGAPAACFVLIPIWAGRWGVWARVSAAMPKAGSKALLRHGPRILRTLTSVREDTDAPVRRVEATVRADFEPGLRLAARLGFRPEARLPAYGPGGEPHVQFAWLAEGWQ